MLFGLVIFCSISLKDNNSLLTSFPSFSANCFWRLGNIPWKVIPKILVGTLGWNYIFIAIQLVNQPMNAEIMGINNNL